MLMNTGHFITPLLLALAVTLPARWSDGLSLDRLLGLARPLAARSPLYGYPIWLMGLCIALAYAAAGLSKLYLTNGAWLWDTGVRWGFVADLNLAATDLGVYFVNNYWLAVLGSVFASFGQIIYLYSCFTRSILIKSAIGLFVAIPFLLGLMAFMGLFWWPWAMLVVLLYIPWPLLSRALDPREARSEPSMPLNSFPFHAKWATCAACTLLGMHAYAVLSKTEYEPIFSNYPMYAVSFPMGSELNSGSSKQYERYGRNFVFDIEVSYRDGAATAYGLYYRVASVITSTGLFNSPYRQFAARKVWAAAEQGTPLSPITCQSVRSLVSTFAKPDDIVAVRYSRRSYTLEQGQLVWKRVPDVVVIDIAAPDCRYEISTHAINL